MSYFYGVLNDHGLEKMVKLFLDLPYTTEMVVGDETVPVVIDDETCSIDGTDYNYEIKSDNNETFIIGKEDTNIWHCCLPCFFHPKYFLLTNKNSPA